MLTIYVHIQLPQAISARVRVADIVADKAFSASISSAIVAHLRSNEAHGSTMSHHKAPFDDLQIHVMLTSVNPSDGTVATSSLSNPLVGCPNEAVESEVWTYITEIDVLEVIIHKVSFHIDTLSHDSNSTFLPRSYNTTGGDKSIAAKPTATSTGPSEDQADMANAATNRVDDKQQMFERWIENGAKSFTPSATASNLCHVKEDEHTELLLPTTHLNTSTTAGLAHKAALPAYQGVRTASNVSTVSPEDEKFLMGYLFQAAEAYKESTVPRSATLSQSQAVAFKNHPAKSRYFEECLYSSPHDRVGARAVLPLRNGGSLLKEVATYRL